ncbi:MAG: peptidyl-prolyl cis-trans isomerase [Solirubrobacterales bacterium]
MSPGSKGNPAAQGRTKSGPSAAARAAQRLKRHRRIGLIAGGALLIALFAIVAVAQGIGHSKPSGDEVVVVEDAPDGTITKEDFDRSLTQTAARQGIKQVPSTDDPQYQQLADAAESDLILTRWVLGEADDRGIVVTDRQIDDELQNVIQQQFGSQKAFDKFLKQSGFTLDEARERIKLQLISQEVQNDVIPKDLQVSSTEIKDYYDANKSQFETPASRDVRVVLTKTESDAAKAKAKLEKDSSPQGWQAVAKKYSIDEATKNSGGLRQQVIQGQSEPALDHEIFVSPEGELVGPFHGQSGYYVIEVEKVNPATTAPLECPADDKSCTPASDQIKQTLLTAKQNQLAQNFQDDFTAKWRSRTYCADGYVIDRCANFEGAPSACTKDVAEKTGCGAPAVPRKVVPPGQAVIFGVTPPTPLAQGPVFPAPPASATLPSGLQGIPGGTVPQGGAAPPAGGTAPPGG